jgi:predicted nuclease of restriction endonuclease-like RecB superfamily
MLSPDHVRVRRQGSELKLLALGGELRERAVELARSARELACEHVGRTREELEDAWSTLEIAPRERKLLLGLKKLVEDACDFEAGDADEAASLRRELFLKATARRREDEGKFERARVLAEVAAARGTSPEAVESMLYADLRGAQRLLACHAPAAELLVESYERAQVQAVLLRAVRVVAEVRCAGGDAYRALFQKLKFRRLMHRVEALEDGGYRIEIDGPFSLFQSVAKYGLELALVLPALEACTSLRLAAEVRWSNGSRPLTFRYEHAAASSGGEPARPRDEVSGLVADVAALGGGWTASLAERLLDVPGAGVCAPDVVLRRVSDGAEVLVEVLGYWSRSAVWRRVELARRGLGARLLFVVSSRLRVSEEVLDETEEAALYVYKGHINARGVLRQAEALCADVRR